MKILFASQNPNKTNEIRQMVRDDITILSLLDLGYTDEIEEYGETLEENAEIKCRFVHSLFKENSMADDTGLIVPALNGEPGVKSARYAGEDKNSSKNIALLLANLSGKKNREAKFTTVISLIINGEHHQFTGELKGTITFEAKGEKGFGYDPVFMPEGMNRTLAELTLEEKNNISHRALAFKKLMNFLQSRVV